MTTYAPTALLRFGAGNAKLGAHVLTFSLPAGHTCPGADQCLSRAHRETGRLTDGPATVFRCFSASAEVRPTVRKGRWANLLTVRRDLTRGAAHLAGLIIASLPEGRFTVRIHVAGDFFSQAYLNAWALAARSCPGSLFYGYTKSIPFWLAARPLPPNLVLTASLGGKYDALALTHSLRTARVVFSPEEAEALSLPLDHDDSLAMRPGPSFALLLHGTQPLGSAAGLAWEKMRRAGTGGYSRERKRRALPVV